MTVLFAALLLVAGFVAARALVPRSMTDPMGRRLATGTLFFAVFAAAFLVQGFAELITGTPAIGIGRACAFAVLVAIVAIAWRRGRPSVVPATSQSAAIRRFRTIPVALARVAGAVAVLLAVLLVAGLPRGYEVHAYHLPIGVRIFRDGTLSLWDHAFMHAYPALMSLWAGFFLKILPERWTALANLPFLALMLVAVYALSRRAGADRSAALIVALGLATVPVFGFSALEDGADIGGVAFTAVAAYFVTLRSNPRSNPRSTPRLAGAALAGVAAGLAFGFKSLNVIPISLFGLFVIAQCAADWRERRSLAVFLPVIVYAACGLGTMSFWLVRNIVEVGNPLYPVHIKGVFDWFGWKAAPGFTLASRIENEQEWVAHSRDWLTYPWTEHHFIDQNFKHSSGLGPFFAMTAPVAVVLWPVYAFARRRAFSDALRVQAMLYATAVVVLAAWWVLGDRQPRYVMVAIAFLMPIAAVGIGAARGRFRSAFEGLLAVGIVTMLVVLLVRVGVENGALLLGQRGAARWQLMQYPQAIDTLPAGSVLANAHEREDSYALLGDGLRNHVVDSSLIVATFEQTNHSLRLTAEGVRALGLTHLYAMEGAAISTDDCVKLREVARLDRNPFNGQSVSPARLLDAIELSCATSAPGVDPARGGE